MTNPSSPTALEGVVILDSTQMMMGPLATQTLADLGADVIKVERPGKGEFNRTMPMIGKAPNLDSPVFYAFNRNKRSITVDLKHPEGRAAILKLAERVDVVVENYRTGVMERLGLGYEDFRKVNPRVIFASGSGWGAGSELATASTPGQTLLIEAMSGLMMNTGRAGDLPTAAGTPVADFAGSQSLAIGILGALLARERIGVGQKVEADLYSSTLNMMAQENYTVLNNGVTLERSTTGISTTWNDAPYGPHQTSDGWIAIAMCPLPKLGPLLDDPDLATLDPWKDREAVRQRVDGLTKTRTTADLMRLFKEADVWAAPIRTSTEAMAELEDAYPPRLYKMEHKEAGTIRAIASPITLSVTPPRVRYVPPLLGEHTENILTEKLGAAAYERLKASGALG